MNNLINLSDCKEEIRYHPKLFLSNNDHIIVLSDELRLASAYRLHPTYAEGQPLRLIFRRIATFRPAIYFIRFISPSLRAPLPHSITFYQRHRGYLTVEDSLHHRRIHKQPHSSTLRNQRLAFTPEQYYYRAAFCA